MNKASDPILEFLNEKEIAAPKGVLDNELDVAEATIKRGLRELEDRGFIERDPDYTSYYRITEKGRGYLAGDVDARDDE
jgi:DNA-binding PadR family transcriptional regulator